MGKKEENSQFICASCTRLVLPLNNGTYRNHCPFCLTSIHLDDDPGDRQNDCHGRMLPKQLLKHAKKGWQIVHVCEKCGIVKKNRIATDCVQPDDWQLLIQLTTRHS